MSRRRDAVLTVASLLVALAVARPGLSAQTAPDTVTPEVARPPAEPSGAPAEPSGAPAEPSGAPAEPSGVPAEPSGAPAEPSGAPAEPSSSAASAPESARGEAAARLRVAVVLVGDTNEEARAAADAIERAVTAELELPADAALRASLLGSTGDDLIAPVVRDRRALGGTEAQDIPLLVALGDRADAALLLVVRRRAGRRELVGFDVRHGAFFDGAVALDGAAVDAARVLRFARARARATQAEPSAEESAELVASAERAAAGGLGSTPTQSSSAGGEEDEPEWIELNWPYLLAGALLAGAAAFVIVYTAEDGSQPVPTLRFRPGGTP